MAQGGACDVLVLTVIGVELGALQRALGCDPLSPRELENGTLVWDASIESPVGGRAYSVCLAAVGSAGLEDAATATADLLVRLAPRFAILAGIAAGMRGKNKIGNVLIAEQVYAYDRGALNEAGFAARARLFELAPHVLQRMTAYWAQGTQPQPGQDPGAFARPAPPPGQEQEFALHVAQTLSFKFATIASGNKLLRDGKALGEIREKGHDKVEAGEMEGAGFCQACQKNRVPWLVVRGISDFGDTFKNDDFHQLAADAAAACTVDLLKKVVTLDSTGVAARPRKLLILGTGAAAAALALGVAALEFQPCRRTREVSTAELVLEADELFSFDLEALNRAGIERLTTGGVNYRVPSNGLEYLEIRNTDPRKPVRLSLRVAASADGQQLHVEAEPGMGTLQVRLRSEDGRLEESQGPVDIYLARRTSILLASDVGELKAVKGTNACWTETTLEVLQWEGEQLIVRR